MVTSPAPLQNRSAASSQLHHSPTETAWHSRQTYALFREYAKDRSLKLRNKIVERNLGLVRTVAHRMESNCQEPFEDLVQIGVKGLIIATEKFQLDRGVAFSSFAIPYIRGAIQHHNRDSFGLVKIPRRSFEAVASVKKSQRRLAAMGRELPLEQVAEVHSMSREKWAWTIDAVARKPVVDIDELHHVAEEDAVDRAEMRARMLSALAKLPRLKRDVVVGLYFEQKSPAAVAREHGLSLSELQELESGTIEVLRQQLGEVA